MPVPVTSVKLSGVLTTDDVDALAVFIAQPSPRVYDNPPPPRPRPAPVPPCPVALGIVRLLLALQDAEREARALGRLEPEDLGRIPTFAERQAAGIMTDAEYFSCYFLPGLEQTLSYWIGDLDGSLPGRMLADLTAYLERKSTANQG